MKNNKPQKENPHIGKKAFNLKSVLIKTGIFLGVAGITVGGILFFRQNNKQGGTIQQDPIESAKPVITPTPTIEVTPSPTATIEPTPSPTPTPTLNPYIGLSREEKLELIFGDAETLEEERKDKNPYSSRQIVVLIIKIKGETEENDQYKVVYTIDTSYDDENILFLYYFRGEVITDEDYIYTVPMKYYLGKAYENIRIDKFVPLSEPLKEENITIVSCVWLDFLQQELDRLGIEYNTTKDSEKISNGVFFGKTTEEWANYYLDTTKEENLIFREFFVKEKTKTK